MTTGFLRDLFTVARRSYDFVIVDTAPAFSPEVIVAIDASSHLCLVGMLDALSLKDTKIGLETLKQMGYSTDDVTLVLNRADSSVGISMSDVYSLLKKDPDILVPSDRVDPARAHGRRDDLRGRSEVGRGPRVRITRPALPEPGTCRRARRRVRHRRTRQAPARLRRRRLLRRGN